MVCVDGVYECYSKLTSSNKGYFKSFEGREVEFSPPEEIGLEVPELIKVIAEIFSLKKIQPPQKIVVTQSPLETFYILYGLHKENLILDPESIVDEDLFISDIREFEYLNEGCAESTLFQYAKTCVDETVEDMDALLNIHSLVCDSIYDDSDKNINKIIKHTRICDYYSKIGILVLSYLEERQIESMMKKRLLELYSKLYHKLGGCLYLLNKSFCIFQYMPKDIALHPDGMVHAKNEAAVEYLDGYKILVEYGNYSPNCKK